MQRPQITTLALPRSRTWPSDLLPPHQAPFHFLPDVYPFAKFMLATPSSLVQDLTKDLDDLATEKRILTSMNDELGVIFVDAAEIRIRAQIAKAAALETPQVKDAMDNATHIQQQIDSRAISTRDASRKRDDRTSEGPLPDAPEAYLAIQTSGYNTPTLPSCVTAVPTIAASQRVPTPTRNPRQRRNLNPPPPSSSSYYYYQAASGMPIFLHPLDIKILLSNFNSYPAFPDTITVRVESYTESTVNEDLRKRCKYLAHFSEGADVVFVETDLEGVVGQEGLKNFERALTTRRTRRKEKGKKDDKARARAEEREKEKLVHNWNQLTRQHVDAYIPPGPAPPLQQRESSPTEVEEIPESSDEPVSTSQQPATTPGAWGVRSFASAAHAAQGRPLVARPAARRLPEREEDEWDLDAAFHELEQRGGRGKRKNNRLVVLGSGGGGGRRR